MADARQLGQHDSVPPAAAGVAGGEGGEIYLGRYSFLEGKRGGSIPSSEGG